ncbi:MAG: UDP-N-acetylmuramoyl-L-alanyl-D-glutamate--2,6-diaminopimelate ligase [Bdellovibrionales bacterium]|nr:UDP-N-acetylmuramoyl-L-alanyl-D-glutamate--2,6-diaminopimelate ligase [Bdellovibrionales bacterium]
MGERSLCKLLDGEATTSISPDVTVSSIVFDSRQASPGAVFFAVAGHAQDGNEFIADAVKRGAVAVVVEAGCKVSELPPGVVLARVVNVRRALAAVSSRFFGEPSTKLLCVGVTGTNGKTSISWITAQAASQVFGPWVQIGTLGTRLAQVGSGSDFTPLPTTTPDPLVIQRTMCEGLESGAKGVVLEASSHASVQLRTASVEWDVLAFTNLTRDHLDYHPSMEEYFAAKRRLFIEELAASRKAKRTAVVCIDNPFGLRLANELAGMEGCDLITASAIGEASDCCVVSSECRTDGTHIDLLFKGEAVALRSKLSGRFNVENLVTSFGILKALGASTAAVVEALAEVPEVPGRIERVFSDDYAVFVDYAHTPAALEAACAALRELEPARLIVVFGCGGDRDRGKRPEMGQVVRERADFAIVTSDNPRSEDPQSIVDEIAQAFADCSNFECIVDRRLAIARAVEIARSGDIILIAGKGHEPYQEINGVRHDFDDRLVAREVIDLQASA